MTPREKKLLVIVLVSLVGGGVIYGGRLILDAIDAKRERITDLEQELLDEDKLIHRGKRAKQALIVYEERALASKPEIANSQYRAWLHEWAENSGLENYKVEFQTRRHNADYDEFTFAVTCQGDLRHLIRLMHGFYAADHLHRIRTVNARRLKNNQLSLAFTIDALSLPSTATDKPLEVKPSQRLMYATLDEYLQVIGGRNPYSPANKPPRFARDNNQRAYVGQLASFKIEADDPEEHRLRYWMEGELPGGARIDSRSGTISWTPPEIGEYEVTVIAEDDGIPARKEQQTVKIVVSEPPEQNVAPPQFQVARYTVLTGVVSINGKPQAWLSNRPEGKVLKLFVGDEFRVGGFNGKVVRINPRDVEIDTEDGVICVRSGQNLTEGEVVEGSAGG